MRTLQRQGVTLVCGELGLGGTERQLTLLAIGLTRAGIPVRVVALFNGGPHEQRLREANVDVYVFAAAPFRRPWALLRTLWRFHSALRVWQPAVVHAFLFHAYVITAPLARLAGVPVLVAGRRSLSNFKSGHTFAILAERITNHFYDAFVANAAAVRTDVLRSERVAPDRVKVIPNGLPAGAFNSSKPPPDFNRPHGRHVILCVANLISYKGHADLLRACSLLEARSIALHLILVGDGPKRKELEGLAAELELDVRFVGHRLDVSSWLSAADVFVLPSLEEGMSNALMEALAAGLPIVATDVGGNAEVLGGAGLLCQPAHPLDLCNRLQEVLTSDALRSQLHCAARERAATFSVAEMTRQHISLYETLLRTRKGATCAE